MKHLNKGLSFALVLCLTVAASCRKDRNVSRSEVVRFYSADEMHKSINYLQIPLEGIENGVIYIESNTPVSVETQLPVSDVLSDDAWLDVQVSRESDSRYTVRYSAKALKNDLSQRTASVNATSTRLFLGSYLKMCQGYELFWTNSFTGLDHLVLTSSARAWTTGVIPAIASTSYDYISFNAYAVNPQALSITEVYPVELSLPEGAYFEDNGRTSYVLDVPIGSSFNDANLLYLPFCSEAGGFSSETVFTFRSLCGEDSPVQLHIDNIKVYKVSDQLREVLEGEDVGDSGSFDSFE